MSVTKVVLLLVVGFIVLKLVSCGTDVYGLVDEVEEANKEAKSFAQTATKDDCLDRLASQLDVSCSIDSALSHEGGTMEDTKCLVNALGGGMACLTYAEGSKAAFCESKAHNYDNLKAQHCDYLSQEVCHDVLYLAAQEYCSD